MDNDRFFLRLTLLLTIHFLTIDSLAVLNIRSRFLSSENGLGSNYVRSIVQDRHGYIWMGATNGLICYDGYTATLLSPDETESRRLMSDERVMAVELWQDRFLWLRLRGNTYCCYDPQTNRFVDYTGNGTMHEAYRSYQLHEDGELWLIDREKGCKIVHFDGQRFTSRTAPYEASVQHEWKPKLPPGFELPSEAHSIIRDNRGNTIVVTLQGELWHIDRHTLRVTHLTDLYSEELLRLNGNPRYSVVTDRDGIIWVSAYGNGLFTYEPQTGQKNHFLKTGGNIAPIQTNYLLKIYEDKAGNIWACQENMGVACLTKQERHTETFYFTSPERMDHTNSIHLLCRVANRIYIGNRYNGLLMADGQFGNHQTIDTHQDDVVAVCADWTGNIWQGTRQNGVYAGTLNLRNNPEDTTSLSKGKISDILCDSKGRIWISIFDSGLDLAVPDGRGGYTFQHFFTGGHAINQPRQLFEDHQGYFWLGSSNGIYLFHPDQLIKDAGAYRKLLPEDNNLENSDEIHCLMETTKHEVLVGTAGGGLALIDNRKAGQPVYLRNYTTHDGMPNNSVQQLIEDRDHHVWAATERGLVRLSHDKLMCFIPANTPQGNMFIENACCMLDDGRLAFGSRHGITIVDPKTVTPRKSPFALQMTDVEINGLSIHNFEDGSLATQIAQNIPLTLDYNENSLVFKFSDFEFADGNASTYTYRLTGYDEDWSPMTNFNFASYKNLPPGHYTMEVKAQNSNGEWNERVILQEVVISPPFWRTWWAYLIYIVLLGLIGLTFYRHWKRVYDLKNRIRMENQLTEYKMQFFTNISHEFRTPLTIIRSASDHIRALGSVPGELKHPMNAMQKSTDRLLRMINQLMAFSKMHEGKLRLAVEETELVGFVRDIYSTFRDMAEAKHISYQFSTNVKQLQGYIDRNFVDKIVYNLLSNAMKYTPSHRSVTVRLKMQDDGLLLLRIEDAGIGISKEKQKELFQRYDQSVFARDSIGIGLHLTGELVRVHHGTIQYEENVGGGSVFCVTLPINKDAYQAEEFMQADNAVAIEEDEAKRQHVSEEYREMPPVPLNKRSILLVEDDVDIRDYLKNELSRYFIVNSASDGQEAMEKIKEEKPELIVSDVAMPMMNGFELTKAIRDHQEWHDIPIVLLTALSSEADQLKGIQIGADAYIRKPFSSNLLITQVSKLLEQRDKLKTTYAQEVVGQVALPTITTDERDGKLRAQLDSWMAIHLTDSQLTIDAMAQSFGYGRTAFFKKVKQLTGMTPNDYIKKFRMERAVQLFNEDERLTIAEIAYKVGYEDQFYFSKAFKQYFGVSPSAYKKGNTKPT